MGRILAIDYGKKRVGLAVTDPMRIIASPLETVPVNEVENFLSDYFKKETVDEIVIGYPLQMNNEPSEAVKYIEPFIRRMRKLYPDKTIYLADERFTSVIGQQTLIEGGVKKKRRMDKSLVDKISASLILQSFLEKRSFLNSKK
ncbi:MAG TPA: Holliday junction resolvase RuvX [Bacteroidales bacterium]|nr:Holliday junction resolvase RuvX [Bacteroidales bacterium]HOK75738.1 Holliday junction resolvase RuvX [Bacteroidales bacterium]HOM39942.1 Holliday junction resolvase RuvX [Bacteroidales bacterium]HOU30126.1 Holliday junction resolvase RuvX [Bacteroidales bacterium]HPP92310.1 Holliday junction resolvase RuvX [Bacteroidales bacterium]